MAFNRRSELWNDVISENLENNMRQILKGKTPMSGKQSERQTGLPIAFVRRMNAAVGLESKDDGTVLPQRENLE